MNYNIELTKNTEHQTVDEKISDIDTKQYWIDISGIKRQIVEKIENIEKLNIDKEDSSSDIIDILKEPTNIQFNTQNINKLPQCKKKLISTIDLEDNTEVHDEIKNELQSIVIEILEIIKNSEYNEKAIKKIMNLIQKKMKLLSTIESNENSQYQNIAINFDNQNYIIWLNWELIANSLSSYKTNLNKLWNNRSTILNDIHNCERFYQALHIDKIFNHCIRNHLCLHENLLNLNDIDLDQTEINKLIEQNIFDYKKTVTKINNILALYFLNFSKSLYKDFISYANSKVTNYTNCKDFIKHIPNRWNQRNIPFFYQIDENVLYKKRSFSKYKKFILAKHPDVDINLTSNIWDEELLWFDIATIVKELVENWVKYWSNNYWIKLDISFYNWQTTLLVQNQNDKKDYSENEYSSLASKLSNENIINRYHNNSWLWISLSFINSYVINRWWFFDLDIDDTSTSFIVTLPNTKS